MIATMLRIGWINLRRDRVVQALTFVLPILFFSIFALVFGNQRSATSRIAVALVDEDRSAFSTKLGAALRAEGGLRVRETREADGQGPPLNRAAAEQLVKTGALPVAVVLPAGLGAGRQMWGPASATTPKVAVLADVSDPVAPQVVLGLLQKVSFTAAPELAATEGLALFEKYGGPLTPAQLAARRQWIAQLSDGQPAAGTSATGGADAAFGLPVETVDVMRASNANGSMIAFYAAGIGVMFLLFSVTGASGTLLDEEESGTLGRLIGSRLGMGGVLVGKWLFASLMGVLQLTVMFVWGALVFGLPLVSHLPGFVVMTVFTAGAAASFGLVLATLSRSRQQLSGLSTIVILMMSAVGGSMFPRFLMSETMQRFGLVTFNAWALDGYLKVFWRNLPLWELWPQVTVLGALTLVFLGTARRLARRWEAV